MELRFIDMILYASSCIYMFFESNMLKPLELTDQLFSLHNQIYVLPNHNSVIYISSIPTRLDENIYRNLNFKHMRN